MSFVSVTVRGDFAALWALDAALGGLVSAARDPTLGQMRLSWWHDALTSLGQRVPAGQPVLEALAALTAHHDVSPSDLSTMVEGWEEVLEPLPLDAALLDRYAASRGEQLFALSARLLRSEPSPEAGRAWALADFGRRCSDRATAERAFAMARAGFDRVDWRMMTRPLRIIARLGRDDAQAGRPMSRSGWRMLRAVY